MRNKPSQTDREQRTGLTSQLLSSLVQQEGKRTKFAVVVSALKSLMDYRSTETSNGRQD